MANGLWFALEIPAVEIDLVAGGSTLSVEVEIPTLELSVSISQGAILDLPLEVPALELLAVIKSGEKLSASLPIPAIELSFGIAHVNQIDAALRVPALRLSGGLISGGVLSGEIEIPALGLVLTLGHQNQLAFALDIPFIDPWLEIGGIPVLIPIRKGFCMNLSHFGVTEYENYPFNSFADYHGTGIYIGAGEDGIFVLDGNDDNGVKIDARIQGGTEDLWKDFIKRLREGFVNMRGGPLRFRIIRDEGRLDSVIRDLVSVKNTMHEERVKIPRGLKNQFNAFILENVEGSDFDLESFRVMVDQIAYRKR